MKRNLIIFLILYIHILMYVCVYVYVCTLIVYIRDLLCYSFFYDLFVLSSLINYQKVIYLENNV